MNQFQAKKIASGARNAAAFVLMQLQLSELYSSYARGELNIPGFCMDALRSALIEVRDHGDYMMQGDLLVLELAHARTSLALARSTLAQALLAERDDAETMRFTQLQFLAEGMRVLQDRFSDAISAAVHLQR